MARSWRKNELALLADTFLFRGMSQQAILELLTQTGACRRKVRKGEEIYTPTRYERSIGILLSGSVLVTKAGGDGPPLVVSMLGRGELLGAAALFNDEPEYATTLTARADCTLVMFTQEQVSALLKDYPLLAGNYIRYLSGRIRFLGNKIDSLIAGGGEQKLSQYLLTNMDEAGRVQLSCSLTELAERLHMGRASLYRAFDRLTREGMLLRKGRQITILRTEGLQLN